MTADLTPGHGGNAGLCTDDHVCPGCEVGGACVDLFEHPICGTVACCADEVTPRSWPENAWPTATELADWLSRCTTDERISWADHALATAQRAARCVDQCHEDRLARTERP